MTGTDDGVATTRAPEVAVIGGGIVGLSTAYALREQGVPVRLYEAGLPGTGQSAGESRIFRHAHDDPRLVAFARESRGVWDEWAEHFEVELVSSDGVVAIGDSALARLRVLDEVGDEPGGAQPLQPPPDGLQVPGDHVGGAVLGPGQLGVGVEVAPQADQLGLVVGHDLRDEGGGGQGAR